jgi:hypothetical protein
MAVEYYSADSAHFPPSSLMLRIRSNLTGSGCHALVPDCGSTTVGKTIPLIVSSIG